jgi:biopolymer transport protein ExbB
MQSLGQIIKDAGIVGIPLIMFSIVSVALILERSLFWFYVYSQQTKVITHTLTLYRQDLGLAQEKLQRYLHLPMARIFWMALSLEDAEPQELSLAIDGGIQAEMPILKRFSTIFDTIITLSPLLGLLGTVLGLIRSFSSLRLGEVGGTSTTGVTSGISEALVSTAFGLVVAIFTLFFANTFRGFYLRQLALFQEYAAQLELLHRQKYRQRQENSEVSNASSHS